MTPTESNSLWKIPDMQPHGPDAEETVSRQQHVLWGGNLLRVVPVSSRYYVYSYWGTGGNAGGGAIRVHEHETP